MTKIIQYLATIAILSLSISTAIASDAKLLRKISSGQPGWTGNIEKSLQRAQSSPDTANAMVVAVNPDALALDSVAIDLPREPSITIFKSGSQKQINHDEWYGRTADKSGFLTLIVENGRNYGTLRLGAKYFLIQATDEKNISILKEVPPGIGIVDSPEPVSKPPEVQRRDDEEKRKDRPKSAAPISSFNANAVSGTPAQLDILLVITPEARAAASSSGANIESWGRTWVAELNQVISNLFPIRQPVARIVDFYSILSYEDSSTLKPILDGFALRSDVRTRRNFVGADVAILVIAGSRNGACGIAYVGPDDAYAYGVVGFQPQLCGAQYTLAHEVGHLMGAGHNRSMAVVQTGDAHGFPDIGDDTRYGGIPWCGRTLMAYDTAARAEPTCNGSSFVIPYFSDPNLSFDSRQIGRANIAYNARVVNANISTVANFRQSAQSGSEAIPIATKISTILSTILYTDLGQ